MPGSLRTPLRPRHLVLLLVTALLAAVAVMAPTPAQADPDGSPNSLQAQLEEASRAYNDAKGRLDAAKQHQADLTTQAKTTAERLTTLGPQAAAVAVAAYKGGRLSGVSVLLDSGSPDDLLARATTLQIQVDHDNRTLRDLTDAQSRYAEQLAAIDVEVQTQATQLAVMEKHKKDLENALARAGSRSSSGFGRVGGGSAVPAPRNPDGSWPKEYCSVDDPTTSGGGCLTPRTLHALQQAQANTPKHFTACFRSGSYGEHPLGRACDFSANAAGFQNVAATGADKAYGDNLVSFFLANADRLAVLYVIWYRQIWLPATGWKTYHGDGTPAGDHVNHVHLSVQ